MSSHPLEPVATRGNQILDRLLPEERDRLLEGAKDVALEARESLFEADEVVRSVYFPLSGVVSLVTIMLDGDVVEMAMVGREGVVGIPMVLEPDGPAQARGVAQVGGCSIVVPAESFRQELDRGGRLATYVGRFNRALFTLVSQNAACNRLHTINQRCARWLLMTHDRVGADEFYLTHEFLSQMLGSRRASVTESAAVLQSRRAISYRRGRLRVLSRETLKQSACECYETIRQVYDRLYAEPAPTTSMAKPAGR